MAEERISPQPTAEQDRGRDGQQDREPAAQSEYFESLIQEIYVMLDFIGERGITVPETVASSVAKLISDPRVSQIRPGK